MKTVLSHGVFDVLHIGHLEHLRQARAMGDRLVVSVTPDAHVHKGPGRPVHTAAERVAMLEALRDVDAAFIAEGPSAVPSIVKVCPAVYCKGPDYGAGKDGAGFLEDERIAVESVGGRLAFTTGALRSSTAIINETMPRLPDTAMAWLRSLPYTAEQVTAYLDDARGLSVKVVGDLIVDEYVYVEPRGKSAKENTITYVETGREEFGGGAAIIAAHLEALTRAVRWPAPGGVIKKTRGVTRPFLQKVFSFSIGEWAPKEWTKPAEDSDITVVGDFGHGCVQDAETAERIARDVGFLALTVQSNSLNWGFNLLTKWPRADYFVVDEPELRLACQDQHGPIAHLLQREVARLGAGMGVVTLGHNGCLVYDGHGLTEAPALAVNVVDRMGAGDAFLAATAPLARLGAPREVIALVGNVAGAIHVGVVGNAKPLDGKEVRQWVAALLT